MKETSLLSNLLKGAVIGISNIIPGVSGGTMMVAMGIYDQLIHIITHLKTSLRKNWKFLLGIVLGIILAVVLLSKLFEYLLAAWPIPTNLAFCGLIAGSLPVILQNVKGKGFSLNDGLCFLIFFVIVIGGALLNEFSAGNVVLALNVPGILMLFLVGFITAATMVIPGVSGSMVLMLLGYYEPILSVISTAVDSLAAMNIGSLVWCVLIMIPFLLGVLFGIFAIAKFVEWVFSRWKTQAYWAIIGLIAASPIAIMIQTNWTGFTWMQLLLGLLCFAAGWYGAMKLARL